MVVIDGIYILLSTLKEEAVSDEEKVYPNEHSKSTSIEANINKYNHNDDLTYQNNNNHNRNIRDQIHRRRAQLRGDGRRGKEDEEDSSRTAYLSSIFRQMLGFDDPSSILNDLVERMELHIRDFHIRLEGTLFLLSYIYIYIFNVSHFLTCDYAYDRLWYIRSKRTVCMWTYIGEFAHTKIFTTLRVIYFFKFIIIAHEQTRKRSPSSAAATAALQIHTNESHGPILEFHHRY